MDTNNRNLFLTIGLSVLILTLWQIFYVNPQIEAERQALAEERARIEAEKVAAAQALAAEKAAEEAAEAAKAAEAEAAAAAEAETKE